MTDPLAAWRGNPFFALGVSTQASRAEVERAGQKLLGLLALGSASARHYDTPFGPATRDADSVRQALATLRDPNERVVHELLANVVLLPNVAPSFDGKRTEHPGEAWKGAERAIGWAGQWAE
jgi:hypothetical protein